jgi:hypothetical protein
MMRAFGVLALALAFAAPASAQDTGTYISAPLDWGTAGDWIDANADGKADFCRLSSDSRLRCTLATGTGFGGTILSGVIDPGYVDARLWGDVDGDRRADFCRRVGGGAAGNRLACMHSTGSGFAAGITTAPLDWGEAADTAFVDATADGLDDFCRLSASRMLCNPSTGPGFGASFASGTFDAGATTGRAWVDFTGDRAADFCRVLAKVLACSPSTGRGFANSVISSALDVGFAEGRAWADVNGDGRADYCRRVGSSTNTLVRCTLARAGGFGAEFTSGRIEWGAEAGTAWVDFDGDGDRDFCRPIGATVTTAQIFCTLWPGLAHTVTSSPVDLGYGTQRAWVDHNGDGKADYCRRVGDAPGNMRVSCTISNGSGFGPLPSAQPAPTPVPAPAPAPPAGRPDVPLKRIVIFLRFDKSATRTSTRFKYLRVTDVPRGATVTARCPKGCSRKSYTKRNARGTVSLKPLIRKRLKVRTTITVTVTRPNEIGAVKILKVRPRKDPSIKTRCLAPGAKRPSTC